MLTNLKQPKSLKLIYKWNGVSKTARPEKPEVTGINVAEGYGADCQDGFKFDMFIAMGCILTQFLYHFSPHEWKWQPTPISLPGKLHGQRSLAGYSPWDCKESDKTEWLTHSTNSRETFSDIVSCDDIQASLLLIYYLYGSVFFHSIVAPIKGSSITKVVIKIEIRWPYSSGHPDDTYYDYIFLAQSSKLNSQV